MMTKTLKYYLIINLIILLLVNQNIISFYLKMANYIYYLFQY